MRLVKSLAGRVAGWEAHATGVEVRRNGSGTFDIPSENQAEICVEVLSPDNAEAERREKRPLYFEAGALEFWTRDLGGRLAFYLREQPDDTRPSSALCPSFPGLV